MELRAALGAMGGWLDRFALRTPARLALISFALVILVFAGLLSLPIATASGEPAPFIDALFVAVSSVCVTGLTPVDTGTFWSPSGLAFIGLAMKVGGLGIMTLASLVGLAISRRLGLTQRMLAANEARATGMGDVRSLLRTILIVSTSMEVLIALALFPRFLSLDYGLGKSAGYSVFYAVSAFNNAGFTPDPAGLSPFQGDFWVLAPIGIGVLVGGLGFPVYLNMLRHWSSPRRWTLHTKLTLVMVAVLTLASAALLALFEWDNDATLGHRPWNETVGSLLFQSVNQRSGGFSTFEVADQHHASWLLEDVMMFIGGGSGSTAGGIRVTTLAVLLLAIWAEARGRRDIEAFGKRIGTGVLRQAVSVTLASLFIVIVGTGVLMWQTDLPLAPSLYEVVSAFATCGLSTGITAGLGDDAKITLIVLMYVGRVGSLTIAGALALNQQVRVIRYPSERPLIG